MTGEGDGVLYIYLSLDCLPTPHLTNRSTPGLIFLELLRTYNGSAIILQEYNSMEAVMTEHWSTEGSFVLSAKVWSYCQFLSTSAHPVVFILREVQAELYQGRNDFVWV